MRFRYLTGAALTAAATLSLLFLAAAPHAAHAQTVFDNGNPSLSDGEYSSDPGANQFVTDTFTFGSTTTFNTVVWYGVYLSADTPAFPDVFTISLYNTTAGTPDAAAFSTFNIGNSATRTPTGQTEFHGFNVYRYSSVLGSPVTLGAGTYGLGIVNNTAADVDDNWGWARSNGTGLVFARTTPTAPYTSSPSGDTSFQLVNGAATTSAPEPSALALLASLTLPLAGMVVRKRRKA